jgi:hypothetical protein
MKQLKDIPDEEYDHIPEEVIENLKERHREYIERSYGIE